MSKPTLNLNGNSPTGSKPDSCLSNCRHKYNFCLARRKLAFQNLSKKSGVEKEILPFLLFALIPSCPMGVVLCHIPKRNIILVELNLFTLEGAFERRRCTYLSFKLSMNRLRSQSSRHFCRRSKDIQDFCCRGPLRSDRPCASSIPCPYRR